MKAELLDVIPIWLLFLITCLVATCALEAGYRLGRWRHAKTTEEKEAPVGAIVASILGLLAFIMAFTFNMAATRFDVRRQLVLEEANAVGTTYLRTRLLPEPQRSEVARLLREYVDVRIHGATQGDVANAIVRSEQLQELLWSEAIKAAENRDANSIMAGLFLQSLNEMIDLHAGRIMVGTRNRLPVSIWFVLYAFTALGMAAVGYQSGLSATRRSPAMIGMVLAFSTVLFLIADLDRGTEGFLKVSQQALIDVQRSMHAGQP